MRDNKIVGEERDCKGVWRCRLDSWLAPVQGIWGVMGGLGAMNYYLCDHLGKGLPLGDILRIITFHQTFRWYLKWRNPHRYKLYG